MPSLKKTKGQARFKKLKARIAKRKAAGKSTAGLRKRAAKQRMKVDRRVGKHGTDRAKELVGQRQARADANKKGDFDEETPPPPPAEDPHTKPKTGKNPFRQGTSLKKTKGQARFKKLRARIEALQKAGKNPKKLIAMAKKQRMKVDKRVGKAGSLHAKKIIANRGKNSKKSKKEE